MLKVILFLYKIINYLRPINYYYYNNGNFMNISFIIYFLNFLLLGHLKNFIFENNIYCVKDNKIWIYSQNIKRKLTTKIIKNIKYNDKNFSINLDDIKKNIDNIDIEIDLAFLLLLFSNIIITKNSYISVTFFNSNTKYVKVLKDTKLNSIYL